MSETRGAVDRDHSDTLSGECGLGGDWQRPSTLAEQTALCQEVGLYLLDVFMAACAEIGVPFYLNGGNLIGAYRDNGWVPWDDDVDVLMLRKDYEKFAEAAAEVLPDTVEFTEMLRNPQHLSALPRVLYRASVLEWSDRFAISLWDRERLALDICILDRAPERRGLATPWLLVTKAIQRSIVLRGGSVRQILGSGEPLWQASAACVLHALSRAVPLRWQKQALHRFSTAFSQSTASRYYVLNHSAGYRGIPVPDAWIQPGETVSFEGRDCLAPAVVPYLTAMYGEGFAAPPPLDQRKPHPYRKLRARRPPATASQAQSS